MNVNSFNISELDYPHNFMLHPVSEPDRIIGFVLCIYILLFLCGTCGNTSVLTAMWQYRKSLFATKDNSFLYILALCLVDLMHVWLIPLSVLKILVGHWILGHTMCSMFWCIESSGKVWSSFILTALSFDRFMGVCHPVRTEFRLVIHFTVLGNHDRIEINSRAYIDLLLLLYCCCYLMSLFQIQEVHSCYDYHLSFRTLSAASPFAIAC